STNRYDPILELHNGLELIVGQLYGLEFLYSMQNVITSYFERWDHYITSRFICAGRTHEHLVMNSFCSAHSTCDRTELHRQAVRRELETECDVRVHEYTLVDDRVLV